MAKNYAALARSVIAALGGVDNISAVTHCMTRLRFVIKDDQLIDSPTLKTIPGVLGVVRSDNQCQVIIGNTVSQAFQEVVSLLPGDMQPAQPVGKPKLTLRRIGAGILDALIGTMSPLIPAIIGGSMVKLLAMILEMSGVLTKGSPTLTILNVIGDGAFFFLPLIFVGSPKNYTIPLALNMYTDPNRCNNYGGLFAMSVISLLPVILVFIKFQKYLVEGIATDGIKG